jgi:hypothetical protein
VALIGWITGPGRAMIAGEVVGRVEFKIAVDTDTPGMKNARGQLSAAPDVIERLFDSQEPPEIVRDDTGFRFSFTVRSDNRDGTAEITVTGDPGSFERSNG